MTAATVPLAKIRESKTNPRRAFGKEALAELTESIRKHGVLQPVLLRPVSGALPFELVAGARRFRAAKAAGLQEIPATVRDLDDVAALEIQVIENLQREDLHPMEEAEGYRTLHEKHGYAVEDLAAKVGKSKGYVYARMKLCALAPMAAGAFRDGKIEASVALLVARIPVASLQEEAVAEIAKGHAYGDPWSYADARQFIHDTYMLRLSEAPFDRADAGLVPAAGACGPCPKRTGNDRDLFGDVKSADVCTDPKCFAAKRAAHLGRIEEVARAEGRQVLKGKEAQALVRGYGYRGDLVVLDHRCNEDAKFRSWGHVLGKKLLKELPRTIAIHDGKAVEAVSRKAARAALKKAGRPLRSSQPTVRSPVRAETDRPESSHDRRKKVIKQVAVGCLEDIAGKAEALKDPKGFTRLVVQALLRGDSDPLKVVAKRRGAPALERSYSDQLAAGAKKLLDGMSEAELRGLAVEIIAADGLEWVGNNYPANFTAACRLLGVNHLARERELTKARAAKKEAKAKKTPRRRAKAAA